MQRMIVLLIVVGIGWYGYAKYQARVPVQPAVSKIPVSSSPRVAPSREESLSTSAFKCDGRTHCSQMTSCAEATFFLKSCPGTKMDGDNDGIPCEQQWCR
jgi:Excalibur calcium-binding domain